MIWFLKSLTIILLLLKVFNVISIGWMLVFTPLIIDCVLWVGFFIISGIAGLAEEDEK